jgi:DNA polymerase-3 subunit epsilon
MALAGQRSFDDLGTPLHDVTFCVVDIETTGGAAADGGITEVGAVRLRGGECLGTFQTLVNPGLAIPTAITVLTGITESMVQPAPRIEAVLPALLEFVGDAVVVGHNVRYDLGFLNAAYERAQYPRLANRSIDTCALARRLVRDEVPDCKLGTLARRYRLPNRPSHRALDDALATGDLLHLLLERAGSLGVTGLDDLLALPKIAGHAQASKLKLTATLPRAPGVYRFRDRSGRVLYVGKATDLRARVRSYFSSDSRRKVAQLLRETAAIDHEVCANGLEAAVHEVRLIHDLQPRFNRQAKVWSKYAYLKLTLNEPFPRLSVVRAAKDDGGLYLGPLSSVGFARRVAEAVESTVPLRRCTNRLGRGGGGRAAPCTAAQLGVATCPCAGSISASAYAEIVDRAIRGLTTDPHLLLDPLRDRMQLLAAEERYEEAADVRDRAGALAHALRRQRRLDGLRRAGRVVLTLPDRAQVELDHGRLVASRPPPAAGAGAAQGIFDLAATSSRTSARTRSPEPVSLFASAAGSSATSPSDGAEATAAGLAPRPPLLLDPLPRDLADELACVATWLDQNAPTLELVHSDGGLTSDLAIIASFDPAPGPLVRRR